MYQISPLYNYACEANIKYLPQQNLKQMESSFDLLIYQIKVDKGETSNNLLIFHNLDLICFAKNVLFFIVGY